MPIFAQPVIPTTPAINPLLSSGARLVASDGQPLPLEHTSLSCEAGGGIARSVLKQRFRNHGREALEVTYLLPLPTDGAVSGYSFTLRGVVTRGKVATTELAREQYEEALMQGRSAALLEQERSSVFRQAIGNVPAGEQLELEVEVDHPLSWVGNGWELRFPTVVAPRYQSGSVGSSTVPVALPATENGAPVVGAEHEVSLLLSDALREPPRSPSHTLEVLPGDVTRCAIAQARLDRDVVVRWSVAEPEVGARLETARGAGERQFGLLSLLPPDAAPRSLARDLIVLLDTSGSMDGEPLAQAVRLVNALVQSLTDRDSLELIEFGARPRRWKAAAVAATAPHRRDAVAWLAQLRAGGGTEMRSGIDAALASLRPGSLRQVVLVSDGLIGFEREVLEQLSRRLPESCRFHCVGVGHGTNGSLLVPAARAGRGVCVIVAPGEDVEPACNRLLARTAEPLVVNLQVSGSALAEPLARPLDLYRGAPALLPLALHARGGSLEIRGETPDGAFVRSLSVEAREPGSGHARVAALYARNRIEDLELSLSAGTSSASSTEREIEKLGIEFQIASRFTSWVAVSEQVNVDGTRSTRRVEQPQLLPAGMSAEGLGLRSTHTFVGGGMLAQTPTSATSVRRRVAYGAAPIVGRGGRGLPPPPMAGAPAAPAAPPPKRAGAGFFKRLFSSPGSPPLITGKILVNNQRRLAISFEPGDVDWLLPERVTVELADGSSLSLDVEAKHSTASGRLTAGLQVRLVCRLDGALPAAPRTLTITMDAGEWVVTLNA
jgi:Ca-activated chloride channel family protein